MTTKHTTQMDPHHKAQEPSRRKFIRLMGTAIVGGSVTSLLPSTSFASSENDRPVIEYATATNLEDLFRYHTTIKDLLGTKFIQYPRFAANRNTGKLSLLGIDFSANDMQSARTSAYEQSGLLEEVDLHWAEAQDAEIYETLHNLSYGPASFDFRVIEERFNSVARVLGRGVQENIRIERTDSGIFTLVTQRHVPFGDAQKIADLYSRLLDSAKEDISVHPIREENNTGIYNRQIQDDLIATLRPQSAMQDQAELLVRRWRANGKLGNDERVGFAVYDLTKDKVVAALNPERPVQLASIVKLPVLADVMDEVSLGKQKYDDTYLQVAAQRMIGESCNSSTNWIMRQLGGPETIQEHLDRRFGYIFSNTSIKDYIPHAGGKDRMHVEDLHPFPTEVPWSWDRDDYYSNTASPMDITRLLLSVWEDTVPEKKEILKLMSMPGCYNRLRDGVKCIPEETELFNKTGTTARCSGDVGILVPKTLLNEKKPYIVVAIVENDIRPDGMSWAYSKKPLIQELSAIVYKEMKAEHRLA